MMEEKKKTYEKPDLDVIIFTAQDDLITGPSIEGDESNLPGMQIK